MYLSKFVIESSRPIDPYEIHQELWKVFPHDPSARRDFLYRVEYGKRGAPLKILMQSGVEPSKSVDSMAKLICEPKEFSIKTKPGAYMRFALCANPVKRLNKKRNRVPLIDDDELIAWLSRKLDGAANLEEASVVGENPLYFRKGATRGKVAAVTFSGTLKVTDTSKLANLVERGIGPAKAFGCGLLSLARA